MKFRDLTFLLLVSLILPARFCLAEEVVSDLYNAYGGRVGYTEENYDGSYTIKNLNGDPVFKARLNPYDERELQLESTKPTTSIYGNSGRAVINPVTPFNSRQSVDFHLPGEDTKTLYFEMRRNKEENSDTNSLYDSPYR